jgi:hypothetical protein
MKVINSQTYKKANYVEVVYTMNTGHLVTFVEFPLENGETTEEVHVETPRFKHVSPLTTTFKRAVRTVELFANPTRSKL